MERRVIYENAIFAGTASVFCGSQKIKIKGSVRTRKPFSAAKKRGRGSRLLRSKSTDPKA